MSSTRKAKDDSVLHQWRFASSPEFERGLLAYLVARRCAIVESAADRELIWFIQYLSQQDGGLAAIVTDLLAKYPERIQTKEMAEMKLKPDRTCDAEQVRKLREAFGTRRFILNGESTSTLLRAIYEVSDKPDPSWDSYELSEWEEATEEAKKNPINYPSNDFFKSCALVAEEHLEKQLQEICLNPACKIEAGQPWYFPRLIETLRDYKDEFVKVKTAGIVVTALGQKVFEVLDYTLYSRGLTLMEGNPRLGKSFAARAWCDQHPGRARFVEVPPSNDEASFFRAIARGLGIGNFLQYKVTDIRERIEGVLLSGDLILVLDEATRLWPQRNMRYGFPSRINWVMAMANHNIPICAIATPQFIEWQKAAEEKGRWNSAQLTGRIGHYEPLPADLEPSDLMAVAKAVLPEADKKTLRALAIYARSSARYLAAIDSISKRARFIADRVGRKEASTADVRKAMQESVIPADSKLLRALESGRKSKPIISPRVASSPVAADGGGERFTRENEEMIQTRANLRMDGLGSKRSAAVKPELTAA